jgi:hypothetical protein
VTLRRVCSPETFRRRLKGSFLYDPRPLGAASWG